MRVGLSSLFLINRSFGELISNIQNSGVSCWELVDEGNLKLNKARVNVLNEVGSAYDVEYVVHAPFADMNIASFNDVIRKVTIKRVRASMLCGRELGCSLYVVHPGTYSGLIFSFPEKIRRICIQSVASLTREAEDLGITLAVENMPSDLGFLLETPEDFEKLFQAIDSRSVGIAFDVGHANTHGNTSNFINRLMDRIVHVHVHDNDGSSDSHEPIGQGTVHWRQLLRRLEQERFNGMIIVETLDDPISDVKRVSRLIDRS